MLPVASGEFKLESCHDMVCRSKLVRRTVYFLYDTTGTCNRNSMTREAAGSLLAQQV